MSITSYLLLFAGGVLGGVINVMAGGAGFMTFPLFMAAGLSELEANAANFVALFPANVVGTMVYAKERMDVREHLQLRLGLAAAGGAIGSWLLVWAGEASFHRAIPWLLVFATASFGFGPALKNLLENKTSFEGARWLWLSLLLEFLVFVYGGYFGLGMGIILLAIHAIFSDISVHHANALRNITISVMTMISVMILARSGLIRWLPSLAMMAGAVVGGYGMSKIARRVPAGKVRLGILAWSIVLTGFAFWKYS